MMKKIFALLLACLLVLPLLAACTDTKPPVATTEAPVTTEAPETTEAPAPGLNPDDYNVLSIETYKDKTMAGFLAQLVGFLSGYEFATTSDGEARIAMPDSWFELCNGPYAEYNSRNKHGDKLLKNEKTGLWEVWNDDDFSIDILNQYILEDMYGQYGTFASKLIKDGWLNYNVWDMGGGHRTYGAYGIMKNKAYLPQFTGSSEYGNRYNVNGEPYIANETLGMNAAGMPNVAVDMATVFGSVTSDRDPTEWLKFFAAMYAMAYFEDDIPTLIREAQKVLPAGCWQREVIDMVFAYKEKYPNNWRLAAANVDRNCYQPKYDLERKMGETSINCAMTLVGMLYGEGDFYETCKIISLAGHGGDSTTPVGLGIVGIACGWNGVGASSRDIINEKVWQNGEGLIVNRAGADVKQAYWMYAANLPERIKITEILALYQKNFESVLLENGGEIRDGNYYIPKSLGKLSGMDTVYVNEFEDGTLDGFTTTGSVAITDKTYSGKGGVKLSGTESGESTLLYTLTGLTVGKTYRVSGFISTTAKTAAELFAKNAGGETVASMHVYDQNLYVKRQLFFTATDAAMTVGVTVPAGTATHRYAVLDELQVVRAAENKAGEVKLVTPAGADGKHADSVTLEITADAAKEAYLKITFANPVGKTVDVPVRVGGKGYATAPFYKTGTALGGNNAVYIPVIAPDGATEYTVVLQLGKNAMYLYGAELVTVQDRF